MRRPERHLVVRQRLRPAARAPAQQHQRHGLGAPRARRRLSTSQVSRAQQVPRIRGRRTSGRRRPVLSTRDSTDRQTRLSYSYRAQRDQLVQFEASFKGAQYHYQVSSEFSSSFPQNYDILTPTSYKFTPLM